MALLRLNTCTIDFERRCALRAGEPVPLTAKELALLDHLARHAGTAVSRDELLAEVWGYRPGTRTRTLDTTVKTLRQKIERDPKHPEHVLTEHGVGYRLVLGGPAHPGVPAPDDALVGRSGLLGQIRAVLDGLPGATVVIGPGGVGKSRVVVAALQGKPRLVPRWIELTGLAEPGRIRAAIATGLGLEGPAELPRLVERVANGPEGEWLVLDECEAGAAVLGELLPLLVEAGARVLATSRVPLEGADTLRMEGLSAEEGAALLQERAAPGRPVADPARLEELMALSVALDGIPLALELVAPQLRVRTAAALAADLGAARGPDVEATVAWSVELLAPSHREAFVRLGTFAGDFDVRAAHAVLLGALETEEAVERALEALVDASLLRAWTDPVLDEIRFRFWTPVRAVAARRLAERSDRQAVARSHAGWLADRVAEWARASVRPDGRVALERLRRGLGDTLALPDHVGGEVAARLLCFGVLPLRLDGRHDLLGTALDRALGLLPSEDQGDTAVRIRLRRVHRARAVRDESALEADLTWLRTVAPELAERAPILAGEVARVELGVALGRGDPEGALAHAERAITLLEPLDPVTAGMVRADAALLHARRGDRARAIRELEQAVDALATAGPLARGLACANLASLCFDAGELAEAEAHAQTALTDGEVAAYASLGGQARSILAQVALERGELERARVHADEAVHGFVHLGRPDLEARVLPLRAGVAVLQGDTAQARADVDRLGGLAGADLPEVQLVRAQLLAALGQGARADRLLERLAPEGLSEDQRAVRSRWQARLAGAPVDPAERRPDLEQRLYRLTAAGLP